MAAMLKNVFQNIVRFILHFIIFFFSKSLTARGRV